MLDSKTCIRSDHCAHGKVIRISLFGSQLSVFKFHIVFKLGQQGRRAKQDVSASDPVIEAGDKYAFIRSFRDESGLIVIALAVILAPEIQIAILHFPVKLQADGETSAFVSLRGQKRRVVESPEIVKKLG